MSALTAASLPPGHVHGEGARPARSSSSLPWAWVREGRDRAGESGLASSRVCALWAAFPQAGKVRLPRVTLGGSRGRRLHSAPVFPPFGGGSFLTQRLLGSAVLHGARLRLWGAEHPRAWLPALAVPREGAVQPLGGPGSVPGGVRER